jgi:transposase InsO family protein
VSARLQAAFEASGSSYGSRRLGAALHDEGMAVGRWRVRTLMQEQQLRPTWKRKFIHTTDGRHTLAVTDNVLQRQCQPPSANKAWVASFHDPLVGDRGHALMQ